MIKPAFMPSELTSFDVEKDVQNVLASLEGENTFLKEEILFLKEKLGYAETEHEKLMGYLRAMQQDKFGRKADVISDDKTGILPGFENIFDEVFEEEDEETSEDSEEAPGKKKGRKPLPKNLPRRREIHDLSEAEKICSCGCMLQKIGEEVSEKLDYIPAQATVIEVVRFKYACKSCEEGVKISPVPPQAIPKGIPTAGLLAYVLTSKFVDHLPLYRQSTMFQRLGVHISRATMSGWVLKCGDLLSPLRDLLKDQIVSDTYVRADETTVQVLQEITRKDTTKSYMWVYLTGSHKKFAIVYEYQQTRAGAGPEEFLKNFTGYLQTDAYSGYNGVTKKEGNTAVGCWGHARRKYVDVVKMFPHKPGKAAEIVGVIKGLYKIEEEMKERKLTPEEVKIIRQEKSKPILEELKKQLQKLILLVPPKNPLAEAIGYTLNNWKALIVYLEDGRLDIDNNAAERAIRPFAIGRKNWLFMGNPKGAEAAAVIYSLIETAKGNGIEPYKYLRYLLQTIPSIAPENLESLLPWNVPLHVKERLSDTETL